MNKELNSIGINKKPSETTVVVAMSGGVDSSTVAGIMKKEGYKVIGITLKLYDDGKDPGNCTGGATGYIDKWFFTVNHIYSNPTPKATYQTEAFDPEGILGI